MASWLEVIIAAYHLRLVRLEGVEGSILPGRAFTAASAPAVLHLINWRGNRGSRNVTARPVKQKLTHRNSGPGRIVLWASEKHLPGELVYASMLLKPVIELLAPVHGL